MFTPALVAAVLLLNTSESSSTFAKAAPTVTITDIKLSDHATTQLPVTSSLQPATQRLSAPVDAHIQPIDPAAEIYAKILEFSE